MEMIMKSELSPLLLDQKFASKGTVTNTFALDV